MQVPLMNGIFASAALLVGVLRTLLNVPMFSHSRAVLSKQFQTTGPLNNRLSLPNFKFYLQYSSQILKHLCDFPLPHCFLGITVVSVLQNTRGSTLGKERGTFE